MDSSPRIDRSQGSALGSVCVLGLGRTGLEVARYLADRLGTRVDAVTLYGGLSAQPSPQTAELERAGVAVVLGTEEVAGTYDLAIVSPGIPERSPFFLSAKAHARELVGEPEFAFRESPDRWVAITGTNGKTTTTMLTTALLQADGGHAEAVGNVGVVATGAVAAREEGTWFVAELSSFQLATTQSLHPRVACLLNVTPDHVEWHGSMQAYADAKERVFANLDGGDLAVVSCEDDWCRAVIERLEARGLRTCHVSVHGEPACACAAFVRDGRLVVRLDGVEHALALVDELGIRGEHNVQNALASAACALEVGVADDAVRRALVEFRPLEHRIETCGEAGGVRYVDDSKATNVDAVAKALTAFEPGRIIVLLGGHDKGTELDSLAQAVHERCKAAVCYGEAGERIAGALTSAGDDGLRVVRAEHLRDAVEAARALATSGDTVLLSPACSSFDEFTGYHARGVAFKEQVAALCGAEGELR